MCIQREKARESGLELKAVTPNIMEHEAEPNSLIIESGQQLSPVIYTDEQRVMQVLLNLQSNALKFTQRGGVTLKVEIVEEERRTEKAKYLKISVTDTGVGIPWEDQDKLFKLFGFVQST